MNKKLIPIVIISIILFSSFASSLKIDVEIKSKLGGMVEYFDMKKVLNSDIQEFKIQWYNSQSISCKTRIEFKIYKNDEYLESVWSEEKITYPGESEYFYSYWLPISEGNFSVRPIVHHCNEVIEGKLINFSVLSLPKPQESIGITAKNLPKGEIEVKIKSNETLKNVVIIPKNYPLGWIFTSKKIEKLEGEEKTILTYKPSVWSKETVTLQAISVDGKYSSKEISITVKKEESFLEKYGYYILIVIIILLSISNLYLLKKAYKKPIFSNRKL